MEPATIAAAVIALLGPYLKSAGQKTVEMFGEVGVKKVEGMLGWLRKKLAGDQVAASDLSRFEKNPDKYEDDLKAAIEKHANQNPSFAEDLGAQVKQIGPTLNILQEYETAKQLSAGKIKNVNSGVINVTQKGKSAEGVVGPEIENFG